MMPKNSPSVRVQVNIEVSAAALQTVVATAKQMRHDGNRIDPADLLSDRISRFLQEKDFERFVQALDVQP